MKRKVSILLVVALVLSIGAMVGAQMSSATTPCGPVTGAIWTTDDAGIAVNKNLYESKDDVYLNGGPDKGGKQLPDGQYYIQVTEPNGTVLGTSVGKVSEETTEVADGTFVNLVQLSAFLIKKSDGKQGYDDTGNKGGEYKVWVSQDPLFKESCSKTDNFKVRSSAVVYGSIAGLKYEDINMNGKFDVDEPTVKDWVICLLDANKDLVSKTQTADNGTFFFDNLDLGEKYYVCEEQQIGWLQTEPVNPDCYEVNLSASNKDETGLKFGNTRSAKLTIVKFYDYNGNGVWDKTDSREVALPGWMVTVNGDSTTTPYEAYVPAGDYEVTESMPVEKSWRATTPTTFEFTLEPGENKVIEFGNLCVGAGGGKTLGFWSNKNGQALVGSDDLSQLSNLNLRKADGTDFNTAKYSEFRTWLLNADATNMAYMLSAQLAAMKLNVHNGLVSGTSLVWTGAGSMSINDLMDAANKSLETHVLTPAGHAERAKQECLKNLLDYANNNTNFIQTKPCPYTFS